MLGRIFKRRAQQVQTEALPASLEAAIQGMSVAHRAPHDGGSRVLVAFAGESTASWYHSEPETKRRLAAAWPGLTDAQLVRACRAVNGVIRAHGDNRAPTPQRDSWAGWRPQRSIEDLK